MKRSILTVSAALTAVAVELPPSIPEGQVSYDEISYQSASAELPAEFSAGAPTASYDPLITLPARSAPSSHPRTIINLQAYSTDYQVRGMGVTNGMSKYGTSALSVSHTFANRNLFQRGIQHRVYGLAGVIWDASCPLGDVTRYELGYAIGKEVMPNLLIELGYGFHRGGLEGFMAKTYDRSAHRTTQDITFSISYNDRQKGFFGHALAAASFYGLTGYYFDLELGYRFTDVFSTVGVGWDVEASAGVAPSLSYWGHGVEGIDACRIKLGLLPYSQRGAFGRDAHLQIKPWVQCSWSGNNARKIARHTGPGHVDHFQITLGVDVGWQF